MSRELLPIGSVVKLKDTDRAMMICGFCPTGPARPGYVYDYSGFPYPEGYMDTLKIYQFDNAQIDKVWALGYQDKESFIYMNALRESVDEVKKQTAERFKQSDSDDK